MNDFTLNAEVRSDLGKGASRRLRRLAAWFQLLFTVATKP
jgi:ribosomal protein L25 (general stress protein Ctc)